MNHYYQRLIRTGASELTIADYQRQQLAVIYFVFLFHFFVLISSGAASSDRVEVSRGDWSYFRYCSSLISTYSMVDRFIVASSVNEA